MGKRELEKIKTALEGDPISCMTRIILTEATELAISDKDIIEKIVKKYLKQMNIKEKLWPKVVAQHTQKILDDILSQIRGKLESDTAIDHELLKEYVEFKDYVKTVEKGVSVKNKDTVADVGIVNNVIGGYKKSIFAENSFDAAQEKYFADILDKDKEIESWIRNPKGQFTIRTRAGVYSPDFVVKTKRAFYLVEIKERRAIDNKDADVFEKAEEAQKWCTIVSKATKTKWEYRLVPHDTINKANGFIANISNAVKLKE